MTLKGWSARRRIVIVALVAAWLAYTWLLGSLYVMLAPSPDHATYDYLSWVALDGQRLWVDVADHSWPGQIWLHMLSTGIFGNHLWSYRLLDYFLMLLAAVLLAVLVRREIGLPGACLAIVLYQAMYVTSGEWAAGTRDLVAAHLLLGAGLAYRARVNGGSWLWMAVSAAAGVLAVMIRPTYALFGPLMVVVDMLLARRQGRPFIRVLADAAAGTAWCVLLLGTIVLISGLRGSLGLWYETAVRFNFEIYGQTRSLNEVTARLFEEQVRGWHWYLLFAGAGAWLWWKKGHDRFGGAMLVALALTSVVSAYYQMKGFGYHIVGVLPVLGVFAASFMAHCLSNLRGPRRAARISLAVIVCGVAVLGLAKKVEGNLGPELRGFTGKQSYRDMLAAHNGGMEGCTVADVVEAADYVRRTAPAGEKVLTWGRSLYVNFLARRRSPARFITHGMYVLARDPFPLSEAWSREIEAVFRRDPPLVVLLPGPGARLEYAELWLDSSPSASVRAVREQLKARYTRETAFGTLEVYRLNEKR